MTKCVRVCGAYSIRLSRRHSTLLLIASFIVTMTVILHLYSSRHRNQRAMPLVGEYDYRPGRFLKGKLPNENKSYCEFNYGLPDTMKWTPADIHRSPEMGNKLVYRVIYNAVRGRAYANYSSYNAVTYATQATPEFLYHIVEIARYWDGPISVTVYVPDYDLDITMQIMVQLCHCHPGMSKVSLHLFYPRKYHPTIRSKEEILADREVTTTPADSTTANISIEEEERRKLENYRNLDASTRFQYINTARQKKAAKMMGKIQKHRKGAPDLWFQDCSGLGSGDIKTFRKQNKLLYPINVGRNVARNASTTNYFLMSDIEMVPSDGLAPKFLTMIRKLMGDKKRDAGAMFMKTVFVVPLFEVERGEALPRDKDTLMELLANSRAKYFHQKVCSHCQRFPGLQAWIKRPSSDVMEPMMIARREYPYHRWEPIYFGTNAEPWYSELLSWEGRQDKMTQMLEICLQEYRFVVLDGGFLCHAAVSKSTQQNGLAERSNKHSYAKIVEYLKKRYTDRVQCKVDHGCQGWWFC